jgi:molybdopterin/thiamine biosynthesis adenylyltransferase
MTTAMIDFSDEQLERYSRQILLPEVGVEGQARIMQGRVLVIGAGGLGSPAALYLAAAGVGTLGLVDGDCVDLSNLQRQILHTTPAVGQPKVESAARALRALNPEVVVRTYQTTVRAANVLDLLADYDFVVDGTDNFAAKFLINDACVKAGKPFSHAGILRFDGQTMTVLPGQSACYRCAFREPPPPDLTPSCSQAGILGPVAGLLGTIQACEALKLLAGVPGLLTDALLTVNARTMEFRRVRVRRSATCPACGVPRESLVLADGALPVCDLGRRDGPPGTPG